MKHRTAVALDTNKIINNHYWTTANKTLAIIR